MLRALQSFTDSVLYSYAQILFSNRRWFGAVLLIATFFHVKLGWLSLSAVIISNFAASVLKFDSARIRSGFYGFNGVLFGAAYGYFYELTPLVLILFPIFVIITFLMAVALENYLASGFNLPGLSLPFVLALYVTIVFMRNYDGIHYASLGVTSPELDVIPTAVKRYFQSLGLILLQTNAYAGVLMAAAMLLFSRVQFVLSILGYAAGLLFLTWMLPHKTNELAILAGLNGTLTAIALGGSLVIPSRKSLLLALIGVLMVVIFCGFFSRISAAIYLPALVLPFNAIVLASLYSLKFRQKSSGLVLLYFAPGSPEENLYYHQTRQARFERLKYFMPDLPFLGEWTISQGQNGQFTHRDDWRYAWDFVVTDDQGSTHSGRGDQLRDYYCYRLPVTAPLDGEVVTVVDSIPNNPVGEMNLAQNWGNTIILAHGEGLYSALSHLEPGSAKVKVGDRVKRGAMLALCGSSGRSPEPHLHFQFQATDQQGDRTLLHPFGYFLEDRGSGYILRTAEHPVEGARVQNLIEHQLLHEAFAFRYGSRYRFECRFEGGATLRETWEVKVDIYNSLYLESSAGATASFFANDKVFYLTGFQGNRRSALYYFYLSAVQVPLAFRGGLAWEDSFPLSKVDRSWSRYVMEPLVFFGPMITSKVNLRLHELNNSSGQLAIESELVLRARGSLGSRDRRSQGEVILAGSAGPARISYYRGQRKVFEARAL